MTLEELTASINRDLEERTNQIWALVRENRHSLDSERYCRLIREALNAATEAACNAVAPLVEENEHLRREMRSLRESLKKAEEGLVTMNNRNQSTITRLTKEIAELSDKSVEVN